MLAAAMPLPRRGRRYVDARDKEGSALDDDVEPRLAHAPPGGLGEVDHPDLGKPSVRTLGFIVSDRRRCAERDTDASQRSVQVARRAQLVLPPGRRRAGPRPHRADLHD
jgi:hypothetical protein